MIVPLYLANDPNPELDLQSDDGTIGGYKYKYHEAVLVGDDLYHRTAAVDYRGKQEMRIAATIYIAGADVSTESIDSRMLYCFFPNHFTSLVPTDVNEENAEQIMNGYTQHYPPLDSQFLLSTARHHWDPNDTSNRLPVPNESSKGSESELSDVPDECGLYIARSTIPNAGQGIFTGIARNQDDVLGYGDPVLPIIDLQFHMGTDSFFSIFNDYVWDAYANGMHFEGNTTFQISSWNPGLDCAINCHLGNINVYRGGFDYDDQVGGHRSQSPSAGAMTPYHNQLTYASTEIPVRRRTV